MHFLHLLHDAGVTHAVVHLLHDAVVTELETSDDGQQVQSVHYLDANTGKESKQTARYFILCASTIESTRILLNSTSANHPTGLGNGSGTLGRYLMDHLGYVAIGNVEPPSEQQQGVFFGGRQGLYLPHFHFLLMRAYPTRQPF